MKPSLTEPTEENALELLSGNGHQNGSSRPWDDDLHAMPLLDLNSVPIDDPIGLYFFEMRKENLLTAEEEVQLAKEVEAGEGAVKRLEEGEPGEEELCLEHVIEVGEAARARLIRANMRLVVSIAKRYRGHNMPFLDLIQEGHAIPTVFFSNADYQAHVGSSQAGASSFTHLFHAH